MIVENFISFMHKILLFSSFINTSTGFPKPLSLEEEKKYFERFKAGDKKARDVLISHNLRLVAHIVKKYSGAGEADDLISVGSIGLIKAINTFDLNKGAQLSTYAARCIENEILMLLRVNKKHTQNLSLSDCLGSDKDGNEIVLEDILYCDDEGLIKLEKDARNAKLYECLKKALTKREYDIIVMRYGLFGVKPQTQMQIASKLGISRSYISRIESKAISEMQKFKEDLR